MIRVLDAVLRGAAIRSHIQAKIVERKVGKRIRAGEGVVVRVVEEPGRVPGGQRLRRGGDAEPLGG